MLALCPPANWCNGTRSLSAIAGGRCCRPPGPLNSEIARLDAARIHRITQVDCKGSRRSANDQAAASRISGGHGKTNQIPVVKASCWDWPLMATRPSAHEVTCLVAIAEP